MYEIGKMMGKPKVHIKHNRRKDNLQLYLIAKPRTPIERQQNKEALELATKFVQNVSKNLRRACLAIV